MWRTGTIIRKTGAINGCIDPFPDLIRLDPHVLGTETYILFNDISHDLIVRILENHSGSLADLKETAFVGGLHSVHPDHAFGRQKQGVQMFCKSGFARTVMAENGNKSALLNFQIHAA